MRVFPSSTLTCGPGVIVHSDPNRNPIIGRRLCSITTLAPGARITLGTNVGVSGVCLTAAAFIDVGKETILGADPMILDNACHTPGERWTWANDCGSTARGITIGRVCFIGTWAILLMGVTIGANAIVAAGAVVTKDVPAASLASGNPAIVHPLSGKWVRGI